MEKWFSSFQGSRLGTHCLEAPASTVARFRKFARREPWGQCVPRQEPRNEIGVLLAVGELLPQSIQFLQRLHRRQVVDLHIANLIQQRIFGKSEQ